MVLNLTIPQTSHTDFTPRITVIGVGGGGTNAVNNMIDLQLRGVEFVVANTDAQQLMHSHAERRIQLGPHLTQGLGAGAKPEIGRAAADEAADELMRHLDGVHMVFIAAGMGGGTGTGAAPVIARMARERGILTVGVVTKPFDFEGTRRCRIADAGIAELQQFVDTLIVIPNQNLFRMANERTSWQEAFKMADHVLYMGVRGVTDLMIMPGLVNLDFADIRTVMAEMGKAMMGTGEAEGEGRAVRAAEAAISNPLLEDTNMRGARGLLINITGGPDLLMYEVDQAANRVREEVADDANIIFGSAIDENLAGRIRVSVVATGIEGANRGEAERPRLVAVGGGFAEMAEESEAEPEASATVQPLRAAEAPRPLLQTLGQGGMAAEMRGGMAVPMPSGGQQSGFGGPAPQPVLTASASPAVTRAVPVRSPPRASGLFAAESAAPPPAPTAVPLARSLFGVVTGALRRGAPSRQPAQPRHVEPEAEANVHAEPIGNQAEEAGLDIPAFLRRQSST